MLYEVITAIDNSLDLEHFVEFDTSSEEYQNAWVRQEQNQIDFDKDIDDILKEIENDPDLKISYNFV